MRYAQALCNQACVQPHIERRPRRRVYVAPTIEKTGKEAFRVGTRQRASATFVAEREPHTCVVVHIPQSDRLLPPLNLKQRGAEEPAQSPSPLRSPPPPPAPLFLVLALSAASITRSLLVCSRRRPLALFPSSLQRGRPEGVNNGGRFHHQLPLSSGNIRACRFKYLIRMDNRNAEVVILYARICIPLEFLVKKKFFCSTFCFHCIGTHG